MSSGRGHPTRGEEEEMSVSDETARKILALPVEERLKLAAEFARNGLTDLAVSTGEHAITDLKLRLIEERKAARG